MTCGFLTEICNKTNQFCILTSKYHNNTLHDLYFAYLTESASVVTLISGLTMIKSNSSTSCISPEEVLYIVKANIVKGIFVALGTSSVSTNTTVSLTEARLSNELNISPKNGSVAL